MDDDDIDDVGNITGEDWLRALYGSGVTPNVQFGADSPGSGPEFAGPMGIISSTESMQCSGGSIPVYVEGQGFRGCYSPDESWIIPFLNKTGKFATLPADDPAISNLIDPEEGKKLQELIEKYGEDVVRDMQNKYDELVDFIGNVPEDPLGSLQKMIEVFVEGTTGVSADCQKQVTGTETELETWLMDCVNVNIIGSIGLPIPGALGGILGNVTLRDLKDAAGKIGTTIEDIISGDFKCGTEEEPEDCTPESLLNKIGDWVVNSVEDIFGNEEDKITIESILGKLGGIFGGVLGGIIYGEFKDLINGEIEDVIGIPVLPFDTNPDCESKDLETIDAEGNCGDCKQPGFVFDKDLQKCVDPNAAEPFDEAQCTEQGYFEQNKAACETAGYVDCDAEVDQNTGQQLTGGIVKGVENCGQIETLVDEDCPEGTERAGLAPQYDFYDINKSGTFEFSGNKYEYDPCNPSDGSTLISEGEDETEDGGEGQPAEECAEITDENADRCGKEKCPDGTFVDKGAECPGGVVEDPEPTETPYQPDCSQPRPFGLVTFDLIEQQRAWDRECGGQTGPSPCDQQDRVTNEDGSCGPCKPGFVEDPQGFDQCIRAPQECNDCSCAEYAAANPQECGETPTAETGGGASVGGSAGGAFSPFLAGISYTPQPVPEVIQQPSGMFTGAQPTRNTQLVGDSIIQNIFKEYFV
jgi:hypothetical protein